MKKDKDWLSEQVGELDSTDAVFNESGLPYIDTVVSIERVFDLIYQLDEPEVLSEELPVIPQFVADWIKEMKQDERPLYSVMSSLLNKTNHEWAVWKSANKNFSEVVAQAWLYGYTVEKEPKYCVVFPEITGSNERYLVKDNDSGNLWIDGGLGYIKRVEDISYKFTEQEIKEFDDRYWAFAVPVEEVTND